MDGPSALLRVEVVELMDGIVSHQLLDVGAEDELGQVLMAVEEALDEDLSSIPGAATESEADDLLASVQAWASLATYAIDQFYGSAFSNAVHRTAGWGKKVISRLQRIIGKLRGPLSTAARVLNAAEWSIQMTVSVPPSIALGITWS